MLAIGFECEGDYTWSIEVQLLTPHLVYARLLEVSEDTTPD